MLLDRHDDEQRAEDRRAGEIAARVTNASPAFNWKRYPDGLTWLDIFPEHREAPQQQTDEQVFSNAMLWVKVMQRRKEVRG